MTFLLTIVQWGNTIWNLERQEKQTRTSVEIYPLSTTNRSDLLVITTSFKTTVASLKALAYTTTCQPALLYHNRNIHFFIPVGLKTLIWTRLSLTNGPGGLQPRGARVLEVHEMKFNIIFKGYSSVKSLNNWIWIYQTMNACTNNILHTYQNYIFIHTHPHSNFFLSTLLSRKLKIEFDYYDDHLFFPLCRVFLIIVGIVDRKESQKYQYLNNLK